MKSLSETIGRIAALLALVAMLGVPSPASAAPVLVTNAYPLAGEESDLALAGSATLVGTEAGPDTNVVRSFTPGQAPKTIAKVTLDLASSESGDSMRFSASPSRIVLFDQGISYGYKGTGATYYETLESGPLGGPLSNLAAGCELAPSLDETVSDEEGSIRPHTAIASDGEVIAYDSFGCLVVRDFASGLQRIIPLEATLDPVKSNYIEYLPQSALLHVAGRLIAYRANPHGGEDPSSIVVYDIDTGSELYRAPVPPEAHLERETNREVPTFDLQSDGTLLIANPASCTATVSTIADPTPRPLGIPACYVRAVRDGRALLVAPGPGKERVLEWTPLEAPTPHPIADLGKQGMLETVAPEMNETEVVYGLSGCYPRVYRTSLTEPGEPPTLPKSCPVLPSSPHATLTSRSLRGSLHCPLGCHGSFTTWIGTPKQQRTGKGGTYIGSEAYTGSPAQTKYSLAPNQPKTFSLLPIGAYDESPTVRSLARELRRNAHLRLVLTCETSNPNVEGLSAERARELSIPQEKTTSISLPITLQKTARH